MSSEQLSTRCPALGSVPLAWCVRNQGLGSHLFKGRKGQDGAGPRAGVFILPQPFNKRVDGLEQDFQFNLGYESRIESLHYCESQRSPRGSGIVLLRSFGKTCDLQQVPTLGIS